MFKRVRRESPASYLKVAMLVPKELFEHSGGVKAMTDEQPVRGIELIKEMLAQRAAGANMSDAQSELLDQHAPPGRVSKPVGKQCVAERKQQIEYA